MLLEVTNDMQVVMMHVQGLTTNMASTQAALADLQQQVHAWSVISMIQTVTLFVAICMMIFIASTVFYMTKVLRSTIGLNKVWISATSDLAKALRDMEEFRKLREEADELLPRSAGVNKQ